MSNTIIKGKAWVGGDNITAYDIIPMKRWTHDTMDPNVLGKWALEDADPNFKNKEWALRDSGATIIVAGCNFGGGGKSIEHPIFAVIGAGIQVVLADSFARYNFRNSVNNALPVIVCEGLKDMIRNGDELTVDMVNGFVEIIRTGEHKELVPLTPFVLEIMESGGLLAYTKKHINS
jgi:3-isopropylmalate/(R)-2-methylmalate dehydratase small subunit